MEDAARQNIAPFCCHQPGDSPSSSSCPFFSFFFFLFFGGVRSWKKKGDRKQQRQSHTQRQIRPRGRLAIHSTGTSASHAYNARLLPSIAATHGYRSSYLQLAVVLRTLPIMNECGAVPCVEFGFRGVETQHPYYMYDRFQTYPARTRRYDLLPSTL